MTPLDLLNAILCARWDWETGPRRLLQIDEVDLAMIEAALVASTQIPARYKEAVRLRYLCGMRFAEVGGHIGTSKERARQLIYSGLRRMRQPWNVRRFQTACPGWHNVHRP